MKKAIVILIFYHIFFNVYTLANTIYQLPGISISNNDSTNTEDTNIITDLSNWLTLQTTITKQAIDNSGAQNITEVLSKLSIIQAYSQTTRVPIFYIHGQRAQVLLNGQPLSGFDSSASMLNLIPINSIEAIDIYTQGNSTRFSDGMLGGIINIITKIKHTQISLSPTYPKYGNTSFSYQKKLNESNQIGILQVINNQYGYRQHDKSEASQSMITYQHQYQTGHIDTMFNYLSDNSEFPGSLTQSEYDENPYGTSSGWEIYKQRSLNLQMQWQQNFSDTQSLQTNFQYRQLNGQGYFPQWASSFEQFYQTISLSPKLNLFYSSYDLSQTLNISLGFNYRYQSFFNTQSVENSYRQSLQIVSSFDESINNWRFSQGSKLGITYDHGSFITYDNNLNQITTPTQNETYYPFSINLGIGYFFNEYFESAISYNHNYQLPFIDQSNLTPSLESGFGLKPQTSDGFTLTELIYIPLIYPIKISTDFFVFWIDNQIAYDPNQASNSYFSGANVNLAPIFQYGFDLISSIQLNKLMNVTSSITLNKMQFRSGQLANNQSIKGNEVPGNPLFSAEIHSDINLRHYFHWYMQAQYQGQAYADGDFENNDGLIDAYLIFNTAITYQKIPWIISLQVNNLLNKKYNYYITDINHQWNYYPANGINGALTITYRFN
ncbi:TonB-dependent receptor plug domain-containing protein [Thiotrichales bacterium 19S9-12]|nr:TonB-dependent receptor plug domain-containing protein [Thiotrichales bacterium 19S9-11]MCF6811534.1 TonB-dependent receptor plug domain-containing protein [Thiotrichales bacterium 19S9-12]